MREGLLNVSITFQKVLLILVPLKIPFNNSRWKKRIFLEKKNFIGSKQWNIGVVPGYIESITWTLVFKDLVETTWFPIPTRFL